MDEIPLLEMKIRQARRCIRTNSALCRKHHAEIERDNTLPPDSRESSPAAKRAFEISHIKLQMLVLMKPTILSRADGIRLSSGARIGNLSELESILVRLSSRCGMNILGNALRAYDVASKALYYSTDEGDGRLLFDTAAFERMAPIVAILQLCVDLSEKHGSDKLLNWLTVREL